MIAWHRLQGLVRDRPIVTRLVLAVALAMTVVFVGSAAFVYWRVQFALSRQLDQDLDAYQHVVQRAVRSGERPPNDTPGESYQLYDGRGHVLGGNADVSPLIGPHLRELAYQGEPQQVDVGRLLPPSDVAYRVAAVRVASPHDAVVVVAAISRRKHDEALRELMLQLGIADLVALVAASFVGYRTARAALDPVERYRAVAASADGNVRLPVDAGREDELTRLGETFNALLARIDAANQRERQFLADASHELRTPLSLMSAELEYVLHRRRTNEQMKVALVSVRGQTARLVDLANALLDLEELRSDHHLLRERVPLTTVVSDVVERFASQAELQGRRIIASADDVTAFINARWVDLALGNLVSNAVRYGAGEIRVSATTAGERVVLWVEDDGQGFAEDFVARAFNRFTRAEVSRTTAGSGLGLALVQAVAEAHHGRASISGSRVTIELGA